MPRKPFGLSEIEDRRRHHPLGPNQPAKQLSGHPVKPHKVKSTVTRVKRAADGRPMKSRVAVVGVPARLRFAVPLRTIVCVRRKVREEVLHALRKTGKGARRSKKARRNVYSHISC